MRIESTPEEDYMTGGHIWWVVVSIYKQLRKLAFVPIQSIFIILQITQNYSSVNKIPGIGNKGVFGCVTNMEVKRSIGTFWKIDI